MREHLSRKLFRAISTGWRVPGDLARIAVGDLFELCSHCRREYEAWRREVPDEEAAPEYADYDAVIECIWARVEPAAQGAEAPIDSDIRQARSRAEELLRLGPEQQAEWIRTESGRHAGPLLAEVLIEESRRRTPGYPPRATPWPTSSGSLGVLPEAGRMRPLRLRKRLLQRLLDRHKNRGPEARRSCAMRYGRRLRASLLVGMPELDLDRMALRSTALHFLCYERGETQFVRAPRDLTKRIGGARPSTVNTAEGD